MGGVARLRSYRMSPAGSLWLGRGVALVGFGFLAMILLSVGIAGAGGSGGYDAAAYLEGARRAVAGDPLYASVEGAYGAYVYPPLFAQLLTPLSWVPLPAFVWSWRALELLCLRIAMGSWTRAGWALLFPPVIAELDAGNVHLPLAAVAALAMRGQALPVVPAALLKFGSVALAPLAFFRDRRGLLLGGLLLGAAVAASVLLSTQSWVGYFDFLRGVKAPAGFWAIGEEVPVVARLGFAVVVGFAAIKWPRLAPAAVMLSLPVVWIASLSILVACFTPLPAESAARARFALGWGRRPEPSPLETTP